MKNNIFFIQHILEVSNDDLQRKFWKQQLELEKATCPTPAFEIDTPEGGPAKRLAGPVAIQHCSNRAPVLDTD